jgi:hypothetical protein
MNLKCASISIYRSYRGYYEGEPTMTKKKNNVYFLLLALALAFILMPVLTQSVSAAPQTKTLRYQVVDAETDENVAGAGCLVTTDDGDSIFAETNRSGQATVRVSKNATSADIDCVTDAGSAIATVPLKESGVTRATVFV